MSDEYRDIKVIAVEMIVAGLPSAFVLRVIELAKESEGVEDLVHLWSEAPDAGERSEVEVELQGAIDDREPAGEAVRLAFVDDSDRLLEVRRRQKEHLRRLVEERGGVSEVARRAEMPQPSLSRLLNSMSEPRPSTMLRLAEALSLPVSALAPPRGRQGPAARVVLDAYCGFPMSPTFGALDRMRYWRTPRSAEAR